MYQNSIVTFIDILGFRELVLHEKPDRILKILNLVEYLSGKKEEKHEYSPFVLCFSDSIIRVRQIDSQANKEYPVGILYHELLSLLHIQGELAHFGVLVRGGVSIGPVAIIENKVFGPAFIDAYEIESKYSQYPRISLSTNVFRSLDDCKLLIAEGHTIEEEKSHIRDLLRLAEDGMWFIDYLYAFEREVDSPELYYHFLVKHKNNILRFAHNSDGSISRKGIKYIWLAQYQNKRINDISKKWLEHYQVKRDDLKVLPEDFPALYYL